MKIRFVASAADQAGVKFALATVVMALLMVFTSVSVAAQQNDVAQRDSQDAAVPTFDIYEYQIEGNSLLRDSAIEHAVSAFLGEGKDLKEVEAARANLERAYHDAGYLTVLVSIPEQSVDAGIVILHVVEAPVERLRVKGTEYYTPSTIKARIPALAEGNVPNFNDMQRELEDINRTADLKATPILRPGKAPGTVEVQLDVEDHLPLHGNVEISNRQSPNTTATRLSGSIRYDNLWQRRHSLGLTFQASPEKTDEVRVLSGMYMLPAGDKNEVLTIYSVFSRSKLATLANAPGLGVLGNADIYGLRYARPLSAGEGYSHNFSIGTDYKNVKQSVAVNGAGSVTTPITYMPLVGSYFVNWLGKERSTTFDVTATLGLRGLLGNRQREFDAKRYLASANFLVLRSGLQHIENMARWTLTGKLELQLASGPLVNNEQFSAGGAESVRGYLESELVGDDALRTSFELRTPPYKPGGDTSPWSLNGIAFWDMVRLRTLEPIFPQPNTQRLRGTGLGLRLAAPYGFSLELDWAHALDNADITRAGSDQVHARLVWEY